VRFLIFERQTITLKLFLVFFFSFFSYIIIAVGDFMQTKELLVPVGSIEHLDFAIHNGCDAVYLGGKRFGARAYASNFTDEEMTKSIQKCHLYGVKIYVTVNTMVFERERKSVLEYVDFLYRNGVDAVIVSDLGMISEIHKLHPDLDIHISTQAHTSTREQMEFLKSIGATRVVIDREMSLEEIKQLPNILELEVFIHGALCVSFSGECLMSAINETRSGNRGTCAQYCRMKYKLLKNGKYIDTKGDYLLSTKELNTSHHIRELMNSNITSFKIEGRMKSKEYVGFLTKFYRQLMDSYLKMEDIKVEEKEEKQLKSLFHREFTDGYLFYKKNILNMKTANHIGIPLGNVIEVNKKKIKIKLTEDLRQEDGIKFLPSDKGMIVNFLYNERGALVNSAKKGEIVFLDNKVNLIEKDKVQKTIDKELIDHLQKLKKKKIPISMVVTITKENFKLMIQDEKNKVFLQDRICEIAKNRRTTKEEIIEKLSRLGDTPFVLKKINVFLEENLFLPVSKLNEIRRQGVELLIEKRIKIDRN